MYYLFGIYPLYMKTLILKWPASVRACEFIMYRVSCNQIYIQFPTLLVFPISITIILSPLDFYGIFHPWILKGFTNINSHNILVRYRNIINPILQMRKQVQKG